MQEQRILKYSLLKINRKYFEYLIISEYFWGKKIIGLIRLFNHKFLNIEKKFNLKCNFKSEKYIYGFYSICRNIVYN